MVKQRFEATLININEERKQYELMYQEKLALENTAQTLRNNVQGLETKVKSLENTVQHNNALAQALKKQTTRLLGHYNLGHEPCPDPQSISDMLEESAKNALLVQGLTAQFSDPQQLQEMKGQIDIRFEYERREKELRKEIEDNKWEIEQLKNLTDLTDDTHQKKSRRVKAKNISSE